MNSSLTRRPFILFLFLILAALAAAALPALAQPNTPADPLVGWRAWSPLRSQFDLSRCIVLAAGDANGDGRDDLICDYRYGLNSTRTFVQFSDGTALSGWTAQQPDIELGLETSRCLPMVLADVDRDGRDDIVCAVALQLSTYTMVRYAREPYTSFQAGSDWTTDFDLARCRSVQTGDADGDGFTDLICAYDYGSFQTKTWVQFGRAGTTPFTPWLSQNAAFRSQFDLNLCKPLTSGDVDNDGQTDLLCVYDYPGDVTRTWVQRSGGVGDTSWQAWSPSRDQFDVTRCRGLEAGDANGDGLDDLICHYDYGSNRTRTFVQFSDGAALSDWQAQHGDIQNNFNVNLCRPLLGANLYPNGRMERVCAYDYGLDTTTFVQVFEEGSYTMWRRTSATKGQFDLERCRGAQTGDVLGNGLDDILCAYDYGSNENRTWVQQSAAGFRLALPLITR